MVKRQCSCPCVTTNQTKGAGYSEAAMQVGERSGSRGCSGSQCHGVCLGEWLVGVNWGQVGRVQVGSSRGRF